MQPKVLIISMNGLSKVKNNGKTIETIFHSYPKELLSHIYFMLETEDLEFCNNSLRFYIYEAFDNWFRIFKKPYGQELNKFNNSPKSYNNSGFRKVIRKKSDRSRENAVSPTPTGAKDRCKKRYLVTECMWGPSKWYLKRIRQFLSQNRPGLIFYQANMYSFLHRLVLKIADEYSIPVIVQCTDDYTLPHIPDSFLNTLLTRYYMKNFRVLMKKACVLLAISEKMAQEYSELYFNGQTFVFSNFVERENTRIAYNIAKDRKILYTGNLGLDRWKTIFSLGEALDEYNNKNKYNCVIDIYSGDKLTAEMASELDKISSIRFLGFLKPDELAETIVESDFLLHCESFDKTSRRVTRLSVSTKIGEYIASNRCIIAIGPSEVASIHYLNKYKLAKVITTDDKNVLLREMQQFLEDDNLSTVFLENARMEKEKKYNHLYMEDVLNNMIKYAMDSETR